jgi:plastocyanin
MVGGRLLGLLVMAGLAIACVDATGASLTGRAVTIATATGETLAFDPPEASVPAGAPLTIKFLNRSSLSHNLVFTAGLTGSTRTIVAPGTSDSISIATVGPGRYRFACTIHDGMAGTLVVVPG